MAREQPRWQRTSGGGDNGPKDVRILIARLRAKHGTWPKGLCRGDEANDLTDGVPAASPAPSPGSQEGGRQVRVRLKGAAWRVTSMEEGATSQQPASRSREQRSRGPPLLPVVWPWRPGPRRCSPLRPPTPRAKRTDSCWAERLSLWERVPAASVPVEHRNGVMSRRRTASRGPATSAAPVDSLTNTSPRKSHSDHEELEDSDSRALHQAWAPADAQATHLWQASGPTVFPSGPQTLTPELWGHHSGVHRPGVSMCACAHACALVTGLGRCGPGHRRG